MKAVILGAGQGTRLRPITNTIPKCMVQFGGRALLDWQEAALMGSSVTALAVVAGYKADVIQETGRHVIYNPRFEDTNMVESLMCARDWLKGTEDLIISYGDIIYQPDVVNTLISSPGEIAVVIDKNWRKLWETRMENPLADAQTLKLGDDNKLLELGKKPNSYDEIEGQYIGLIKISKSAISKVFDFYDNLDKNELYDGQSFNQMYMTSFIQRMCDNEFDVRAAPISGGWIEIDSVEDLEVYESLEEEGALTKYLDLNLI